jgi:hypothetical protein
MSLGSFESVTMPWDWDDRPAADKSGDYQSGMYEGIFPCNDSPDVDVQDDSRPAEDALDDSRPGEDALDDSRPDDGRSKPWSDMRGAQRKTRRELRRVKVAEEERARAKEMERLRRENMELRTENAAMHVAHRQLQDEQGQAKEMERLRMENAAMHAANGQLQERNASLQSMANSMFERMQAAARMLTSQPY